MLQLQILGIGCRRSKALKTNVLEALKSIPLDHILLEEVTEIEELMQFNISAAPALLINGQVIAENKVLTEDELKEIFQRYTKKTVSPLRIRKILVPTDFSKTSKDAFIFARHLADAFQAKVDTLHVYHPELDRSNNLVPERVSGIDELKRELLDTFVKENSSEKSELGDVQTLPKLRQEVTVGFAAEEIVRRSREGGYDLIVMGTTGKSGLIETMFGSVSSSVAQNANCPVLFIPDGARYKGFNKMLYASSYQPGDEEVIHEIVDFASLFPADLDFVHVEEGLDDGFQLKSSDFEQLFQGKRASFRLVTVESKSVADGLMRYAAKNDTDLLVLGTVHRGFLEKLMHRSVTKRVLMKTFLPLLVLHYD
jgi:nucleotide-binding universal stress UspA family protein